MTGYSNKFLTELIEFLNDNTATAPVRIAGIKMTVTAINNVTADLVKDGVLAQVVRPESGEYVYYVTGQR